MGTCFIQFRSVVSATIKSDPRSDLDAVALAAPLFIKHHHNTAVLRLTRVRALPYARMSVLRVCITYHATAFASFSGSSLQTPLEAVCEEALFFIFNPAVDFAI